MSQDFHIKHGFTNLWRYIGNTGNPILGVIGNPVSRKIIQKFLILSGDWFGEKI